MVALSHPTIRLSIPLSIRPAIAADLPKLEWYGQYTHFRNVFRRAFQDQEQGSRLMLIADCNDFPIGHIFINFHDNRDQSAYLYSLRVMEMFRGHGIGSRLISEAENIARRRGCLWSTIAVAKDNTRALELYQRLGYETYAEDDGFWRYRDHLGRMRSIKESCWLLQKSIAVR
jgi:ribosomal protein S18 acetylase RimI-like enzyme